MNENPFPTALRKINPRPDTLQML